MKKKPVKTIKKNQLGILAEDINSKFGLAMETYSTLTKKIDSLDKKVSHLDGKVDTLDKKVDNLDVKIDHVDEKLSNQINEVKEQLKDFSDETNSKFETVFNYLSAMEPQSGKIENFEKRMVVVEKRLTKIK